MFLFCSSVPMVPIVLELTVAVTGEIAVQYLASRGRSRLSYVIGQSPSTSAGGYRNSGIYLLVHAHHSKPQQNVVQWKTICIENKSFY